MKETPILFTPENAQKVHEGTKTQTRRIIKPQPGAYGLVDSADNPYGFVGDRLWVREAGWFKQWPGGNTIRAYKANWKPGDVPPWGEIEPKRWMPSLHMPKWACRTWLELTGVRVERLQEISQADAISEGSPPSHPSIDQVSREFGYQDFSRSWFAQLWESINGPGSWAVNPWVWVLTFKKLED